MLFHEGVVAALALTFWFGALCPEADAVTQELAAQGIVLPKDLRVVTLEVEAGVEVALLQGDRQLESRLLEGDTCIARTRSAAAFVAAWSLALSSSANPERPREVVAAAAPVAPLATPRVAVIPVHRISAEGLVSFWSSGVGFQGALDYGLNLRPFFLLVGALVDVAPDVPLGPGIVSRTTLAAHVGAGLEEKAGFLTVGGTLGGAFGSSIVRGSGFDVSSSAGAFEVGFRALVRLRVHAVPWLPGLSLSTTAWPFRQAAIVQGIRGRAEGGQLELCVGAHFALFP